MTHGKVRYSDFAVTDAILVCLNLSENYHMGIYYYSTCFICTDISRRSKLLLPQIICRLTEGFFVFCLVLVLLWSNEACRRSKQTYEGKISGAQKPYCFNWTCPTCVCHVACIVLKRALHRRHYSSLPSVSLHSASFHFHKFPWRKSSCIRHDCLAARFRSFQILQRTKCVPVARNVTC